MQANPSTLACNTKSLPGLASVHDQNLTTPTTRISLPRGVVSQAVGKA